jgi:hypothetical protein
MSKRGSKQVAFPRRIGGEGRIARAGHTQSANFRNNTNEGNPVAPVANPNACVYTANPFTTKSGQHVKLHVDVWGLLGAVDQTATISLTKDGVALVTTKVSAGHVVARYFGALDWIDTVVPGAAHTYGVSVLNDTGAGTADIQAAHFTIEEKA